MLRGVSVVVVCCLACVAVLVDTVNLDTVITKQVTDVVKKDDFVLSLKHVKPRRRMRDVIETLFSVDFPGTDQKFSLKLDRRTKKVLVETFENGRHRSQHFTVDTLHDDTIIRSLILAVNQTQPGAHATLYLDCTSYGMVATPRSMRDMFNAMDSPQIEVFHEKKYPMEVDGQKDLRMVLSKNECPLEPTLNKKTDLRYDGDSDMLALQDDPQVSVNTRRRIDIRSDIPIISSFDDTSIIDALNKLIIAVNELKHTVGEHTLIIERLRQLIDECGLCRKPTTGCATHNPCAREVQCYDTQEGPRCGPCPAGYRGDGYRCEREPTCATDNPCYAGVQCQDTPRGPTCGPCPRGHTGDGRTCTRQRSCLDNPCFDGVQCEDTPRGPVCGPCPTGYIGDGIICTPGRTCRERPCFQGVECRDDPGSPQGFICAPCPRGFIGDGITCRPERTCRDRPCFRDVECRDTATGFQCGPCPAGYTGNGEKCQKINICAYNPCHPGCVPYWTHINPGLTTPRYEGYRRSPKY